MIETTSAHVNIYMHKNTAENFLPEDIMSELLGKLKNTGKTPKAHNPFAQKQADMTQERREELRKNSYFVENVIHDFETMDFILDRVVKDIDLPAGRNASSHTALKFILSNLYNAERFGHIGIRISTNPNKWKYSVVGVKPVSKVLQALVDNGYLLKFSGDQLPYYDKDDGTSKLKNYVSVFQSTQKIAKLFKAINLAAFRVTAEHFIEVKDSDKNFMSNDELVKVKSFIPDFDQNNQILRVLDSILSTGRVTHHGTKKTEFGYHLQYHATDEAVIGGRVYSKCNIQNLSQVDRLMNLRIDGEEVVELDFGSTHPRIIATLEGVTEDFSDPYQVDVVLHKKKYEFVNGAEGREKKLIGKELLSQNKARKLFKTILLVMLYCKTNKLITSVMSVLNANSIDANKDKAIEIITAMNTKNPYLGKYIGAEAWGKLQGIDGRIAMSVLGRFVEWNEVVLPYHDSFIVKKSLKTKLHKTMLAAWKEVLHDDKHCKIDEKDPDIEGFEVVYGDEALPEFLESRIFA